MNPNKMIIIDNPPKQEINVKFKKKTDRNKKSENLKHIAKKRQQGKKKKEGLTKEEKNFFALLIQKMIIVQNKHSKKLRKGMVNSERIKDSKNKGKKNIKNNNTNGDKKNIKNSSNSKDKATFDMVKDKKGEIKKNINPDSIKGAKTGKLNNRKLNIEASENKDLKIEIQKGDKTEVKVKNIKPDVSKIEDIKINPQTKEIKLELIKNEKLETADNTGIKKSSVIDEIVKLVQKGDSAGNKIFRIHLNPPELGKIYIQLSFSTDKKLDMKLYVQKSDVQHYLTNGMEHLKNSIENLGYKFETPLIQTMSEFNSGFDGKGDEEKEERMKKIKFKVINSPFEEDELKEDYLQVMDYLNGRVDIRV